MEDFRLANPRLGALPVPGELAAHASAVAAPVRPPDQAEGYSRLFRSLCMPSPTVVSAANHLEQLCPHTPPEDPDWPAPIDEVQRHRLLGRLPVRQRTICALTAAEMALPVWFADPSVRQPGTTDPHQTLIRIRQWLDGAIDQAELAMRVSIELTERVGAEEGDTVRDAVRAAAASATAAARCAVLGEVADAEKALAFAADACGIGWLHWPRFLFDWWRHCRCRLAFRDATTAAIA